MSSVDLDLVLDAKALTTPAASETPAGGGSWQKIHLLKGEQKTITL